jgi:hypothetical protein
MRQMLEMVRLVDEVNTIGLGEHHGLNFVNSANADLVSGLNRHSGRCVSIKRGISRFRFYASQSPE